jgi:EH domain-containing protein 1
MEPLQHDLNLPYELEQLITTKLSSTLKTYGVDIKELMTTLKWKPIILIIGNYSSGKSTFINEFLGSQIQRTGQAPTDDSFTIITSDEIIDENVPGNTVVSDERLPFLSLRKFGEGLISHIRLKRINAPNLDNIAIIDTPGMLDSVTEKDRGYDYLSVVGELAKISDLIILMFDPYKAGTIKETYEAIRTTLPGTTGEDRVVYVLNRIDECDNVSDLLRSYGALSWNLSQMTGRKDLPRIYLTYSPEKVRPDSETWMNERDELIDVLKSAPRMRLNHMVHEVDRSVRELALSIEAFSTYRKSLIEKLKRVVLIGASAALVVFLFGDLTMKIFTDYPETPLALALIDPDINVSGEHLIWPFIWLIVVLNLTFLTINRIIFPQAKKSALKNIDSLVVLDSTYQNDLWARTKKHVYKSIDEKGARHLLTAHGRHLTKIQRFLENDLNPLYERIQSL